MQWHDRLLGLSAGDWVLFFRLPMSIDGTSTTAYVEVCLAIESTKSKDMNCNSYHYIAC